jgi:hypothetical protein
LAKYFGNGDDDDDDDDDDESVDYRYDAQSLEPSQTRTTLTGSFLEPILAGVQNSVHTPTNP